MQAVTDAENEIASLMSNSKKIKSALISVFHKTGLDQLIAELKKQGVTIYSTGGTADYIRDLDMEVNEVADLTDYPSILGGRVKTLHPKVFGGILARRDVDQHVQELARFEIPEIDLVIVDLYPFEETVKSGAEEDAIIEKIDIGGIALIRAAAKNFNDVCIVPSQNHYAELASLLTSQEGALTLTQRKQFAAYAFEVSSSYDTAIHQFISGNSTVLRYGENPHQSATFHGDLKALFSQLNGKALSYNNIVDIDGTLQLLDEFDSPCFAIIKHTNPCGIALGENVLDSWQKAIECDPLSAFGGILATNQKLDLATAEEINKLFIEVLIAPEFEDDALALLKSKKNRILLERKSGRISGTIRKTVLNGVLEQERDGNKTSENEWEVKSSRQPTENEKKDIIFGEIVVKHLKSNAIALVKNGQLIGSGVGQTSRVDALKQAISKAKARGFDTTGSVLTSDAFFPFSDSAEIAAENGIEVIVEPGGSMRDEDTIKFCESRNMCLIFTKVRHFKH